MTLSEMKHELTALEALPVAERTPDRLQRAFELDARIKSAERRTIPGSAEGLSDRALIQLWLPLKQREAFRAVCKREGLSLSAKLRAMIAREIDEK